MNGISDSIGKPDTGIIIVDHGSRRADSNLMLLRVATRFATNSPYRIVEPAHMELAKPSISDAFDRCVEYGARRIIIFPYFLSPGRHWNQDIPALVEKAAQKHAGIQWLVTAPFGLHPDMNRIIADRIETCLKNATDNIQHESTNGCDFCTGARGCQFLPNEFRHSERGTGT